MLTANFDMGTMFKQVVQHLTFQSPLLFVYVAALVLACVNYRRAPTAFTLAMIGAVVSILVMLASPIISYSVMQWRADGVRFDADQWMRNMKYVSFAVCLGHTLGTGLLVAAIVTGRRPASEALGRNDG